MCRVPTCVMTHIRVVSRRRSPLGFLFYYSTPRTTELSKSPSEKSPFSGAFFTKLTGPLDYRHTWVATTFTWRGCRTACTVPFIRLHSQCTRTREKIKPAPKAGKGKWLTHDGFTRKRRSQNSAQRSWPGVQPKAVQGNTTRLHNNARRVLFSYPHSPHSCRLALTSAFQSSGGLPRPSIFSNTA